MTRKRKRILPIKCTYIFNDKNNLSNYRLLLNERKGIRSDMNAFCFYGKKKKKKTVKFTKSVQSIFDM